MAKRGTHKQKGHVAVSAGSRPVSSVPATAAPTPGESARDGFGAFERGDYGAAIQAWSQARRAGGPESLDLARAEAHFRRALAATTDGRRAQELREAVALAPDRAIYQYHLGLALHRQGQLRPAIQAYETACRLDPGGDRYRRHLLLAKLDDAAPAGQASDVPADKPGGDEPSVRLAALAALRRNDSVAARTALARLPSPGPLARLVQGSAALAAGRAEAAADAFELARTTDGPDSRAARTTAALATVVAAHRQGDLDAALTALSYLEPPSDDATRRAIAAIARKLGRDLLLDEQLENALLTWEVAKGAEPRHEATRRLVSHLHEVLGTRAAWAEAYAEATRHWQAALAEQPGQPRIVHNLALAAERQEAWEEAATRWEELIGQWKRALRGTRRNDEVAADLRRQLTIAHRRLADAHDAAGDLVGAIRALERALNFDPTDLDLRLRAAELALENEQYGVAIDHLRRVLAARPDDLRTLIDLGTALDLNGDDRQGQTLLERVLVLEPGHSAAMRALATLHHERSHRARDLGQVESAVTEMERAVELAPNESHHLVCLGEMYVSRGELVAAKAAFDRAIAIDPDDIKVRVKVGQTYLDRGHEKEAQGRFRQLLRRLPGPVTQVAIGLAYAKAGQMAEAHKRFKHLATLNDVFSLGLLGKALNDLHLELEAERYLDRAAKLEPTNARVQVDLAWVYAFGYRDFDRAQTTIDRARILAEAAGDDAVLAEVADANAGLAAVRAQAAEAERYADDDRFALPPRLFR